MSTSTNALSFVHASDFHMVPFRRARPELDDAFRALTGAATSTLDLCRLSVLVTERLLDHIAQAFPTLQLLLLTGDLFGVPSEEHSFDGVLNRLRGFKDRGTAVVVCVGSHDHRAMTATKVREAMNAIKVLAAAYFGDEKRFTKQSVGGVQVWGIGNKSSGDRYETAKKRLMRQYVADTSLPDVFVAQRPDALSGLSFKGARAYFGAGDTHDHGGVNERPIIPGSVPCFALSEVARGLCPDTVSKFSKCLLQVRRAGIMHGHFTPDGVEVEFHRAAWKPDPQNPADGTLSFASEAP